VLELQKFDSVQGLLSHKHELPMLSLFWVTPSLFVQVDVGSLHVPPVAGAVAAVQIWWAAHVGPPLQTHSARFALPSVT
jgi:hypothetical protein